MNHVMINNHLKKIIRDTVTGGSVLASGAQPPASVTNVFHSEAHTLLGTFKLLYR